MSSPPHSPPLQRSHAHVPLAAVGLILGATACFAILDAVVKNLAPRYPIPLLVWARYGLQAVFMVLWFAPTMRWSLVRTPRLTAQVVRGALLLGSSLCFFTALKYLPLAEATAINYTTPVLVILLAVALLDEVMTAPRALFVVAGMAGMLLIVRPGAEMLHGAAGYALGAACCYAMFQVLTRKLAAEDPRVTLFYPAIVGTLLMTALWPWFGPGATMPWFDVALVLLTGVLGTLGHFLFLNAFRRAPASALTPFTYMQLVWATVIGFVAFGQFPDGWTLAGMAVIGGSGLALALYERRRGQAAPADATTVD
jgi:drug/metabolite transporter (DMT)-like permease